MIRVIDTTNLPILLTSLKEKKYFYDDTPLIEVKNTVAELVQVNNDTIEILDAITEKSKIDIIPIFSEDNVNTGHEIKLITVFDNNEKTIASGILNYDNISNTDVENIIEEVNTNL